MRTQETTAAVSAATVRSPNKSVHHLSMQTGDSSKSLGHTLHLDLHSLPYKIQTVQLLNDDNTGKWCDFCWWLLYKCNKNANLINNFIMTNEAHFDLIGAINKQSCRF